MVNKFRSRLMVVLVLFVLMVCRYLLSVSFCFGAVACAVSQLDTNAIVYLQWVHENKECFQRDPTTKIENI